MKFKAELLDTSLFTQVLTAFSHLAKKVVIHFSPTDVRLLLNPQFCETDGELAYFIADHSSLFDLYKVESKNSNQILLVADISSLLKVLKTAENYDSKVVKLTKKDGRGYLTFELETHQMITSVMPMSDTQFPSQLVQQQAYNQRNLTLIQDVPITVLPHSELENVLEPQVEPPTVKINMPNLRALASIVDRLHTVNPAIDLLMSNSGTLKVSAHDATINVEAHFSELAFNKNVNSFTPSQQVPSRAKVRARKLSHVLHCRVMNMALILLCLVEEKCLIVYGKLQQQRGTITYFIPIMCE